MMKQFILLTIAIATFTACNSQKSATQTSASTTYEIHESIEVNCTADMEWIKRYEQRDIVALNERAKTEDREWDILFFGSSSIRLWKSLKEDFAPLKVVNRGYGGATLRDLHYNYPTVMRDYRPKALVVYCDNDMKGKKGDLSIGELFDHYRVLFARLNRDFPDVPVFFLAVKHSKRREAIRDRQHTFNELMRDYANHSKQLTFIDTCSPLLRADGSIDESLFLDDRIHLNAKGYRRWTELLKPILLKTIKQ
jgi:lysophospholipase L1-like esterase